MRTFFYFLILCLISLTGCQRDPLLGEWVQPIPGQEASLQGFEIRADGTMSSINMQTLVYEAWERHDNVLVLIGKSIGNGQTVEFREEYEIKKNDRKNLELQIGGYVMNYSRKN